MSTVSPARIGLLIDYLFDDGTYDENILPTLELVAAEYLERGLLERPVEFVVRAVQGLPNGSFRAVRDAFFELVEENCLVIFGPWVSENGEPLREYVEGLDQVPIITMGATESMLGEWVFGLPAGSMEEEPIIMATVAALDGCRSVGIAYEDSLIGHEYLRTTRVACKDAGLRITGEVPIPQVQAEKRDAMAALAIDKPDAIMHVGFGLGIPGMNDALDEIGWMPPRYTTTAFEFAATSEWWRGQLAGWIGLDQYDERNTTGEAFLQTFEARYGRRPAYFFPVYCYDVGRLMMSALASARPLTGRGVKESLERIKMMPAASGAPGTRLRFGKFIRHGWVGSEYLVARRVLPDGSASVMHGTIEGLLESPGASVTTSVIQWATGSVGAAQLREVIDNPDLELVGTLVYSADKTGVDAGTLVGRPPTGVITTADKAEILALHADLVLHAASKAVAGNTNTDDIVALLESEKDVITTTSYNHLPTYGNDAHQRITAACASAGTRFHAAGEHPGFMFERLATGLTALCQRVDTITVQEFVDCSKVSARAMLVDLMGMGKAPEDISMDSPMFRAVSAQYEQALGATADVLQLLIDEIRPSIQTATSDHDVDVACGTLAAGTVVGQILSWTALRHGTPVLVAKEYWTVTNDIPEWDLALEGQFLIHVTVEGAPPLRLDLTIGSDPVPGLPDVSGGQLAVAMTAIRAIPDVLAAPSGVVIPRVFGAYRWPA